MTTTVQATEADFQATQQVHLTPAAALRIKRFMDEEQNPNLMLRASIQGGGCAGFKYNLELVEEQEADDWVIEMDVSGENNTDTSLVKLLIDSFSMQYYAGATIDYKVDVTSEQFIVRNPNAKTTCGCGSSFSD